MESILEAFAEERLRVTPHSVSSESESYILTEEICKLEDEFKDILEGDQQAMLVKLEESIRTVDGLSSTERFVYGYRLGALMMLEICLDKDNLIVEQRGSVVDNTEVGNINK